MMDRLPTRAEEKVIEKAARQVVRYHRWHERTNEAARTVRQLGFARRARDLFSQATPCPAAPRRPVDDSAEALVAWTEKNKEWKNRCKQWRAEYSEAGRDRRIVKVPQRRNRPFAEEVGDQIIERLTKGDGQRWAHLASKALALAQDPSFRAKCGRPDVGSDMYGGVLAGSEA